MLDTRRGVERDLRRARRQRSGARHPPARAPLGTRAEDRRARWGARDAAQRAWLADIFLGRAGGGTLRNFATSIGDVYAVRAARVALDHAPNAGRIDVGPYVTARADRLAATAETVSCGIPGHDHPGQEVVADFRVDDVPLRWEVHGRCGFATDFAYRADDG